MRSATMAGGTGDYARKADDLYETPPEATQALITALPKLFAPGTVAWEPAAGKGAIARVLRTAGMMVVETDLTTGHDFLKLRIIPSWTKLIVTNPPYSIAADFVRHALTFNVPVAMLLKATFWHAASRRDLFQNHPPAYVMPLTWRPAMAPDRGSAPTMDFSWTVWFPAAHPVTTCYLPLTKPSMR